MYRNDDPEDLTDASQVQAEVERLGIIRQAIEVERDLRTEGSVLRAVLDQAREDAEGALRKLLTVDPEMVSDVRRLQYEVRRYSDLVTYTQRIIENGSIAQQDNSPEDDAEDTIAVASMLNDE